MTDSEIGRRPGFSVQTARGILAVLGGIWLVLGGLTVGGLGAFQPTVALLMGLMMVANGLVMLWLARRLGLLEREVLWTSLAFLALNLLLTITDEFGGFDLLVLVMALLIVGLLVASRRRFSGS